MRDLTARVPWQTLVELAEATQVLEEHGPKVAGALELLDRATLDANWAATMRVASLDPAEVAEPTDDEWSRLEAVTGIRRGWDVASRLAKIVEAHI